MNKCIQCGGINTIDLQTGECRCCGYNMYNGLRIVKPDKMHKTDQNVDQKTDQRFILMVLIILGMILVALLMRLTS